MNILSGINFLKFIARLSIIAVLAVIFWFAITLPSLAANQGKTAAAVAETEDSDDWMFDNSTYTNDPKTGKRVDQYKHEKTPYRDPNAWFDSPMNFGFFGGNSFGGFYEDYNPMYYLGVLPEMFSQYYFGVDGSGYYPYDGDPNDEEDSN